MTTEAAVAPEQDERLFCYRHPDRETWIRCGRCDKPICTKCGLMGPVGMRCRDCGRLRNDPLTSFTPLQLVLGVGTAVGAGVVGGFIGLQIGIWAIFIGPFAGGLIGETVMRVTGYKRGPVMQSVVIGGILIGAVIALLVHYQWISSSFPSDEAGGFPFTAYLSSYGIWALLWIGATIAGAFSRIR